MDDILIGVGLRWIINQNRPNKCTIGVSKIGQNTSPTFPPDQLVACPQATFLQNCKKMENGEFRKMDNLDIKVS